MFWLFAFTQFFRKNCPGAVLTCAKAEVNRVLNFCFVAFVTDQTAIHFDLKNALESLYLFWILVERVLIWRIKP